jgi:hypothetical protein
LTFDEVWEGVALGAVLIVSNGRSAPPESATLRFNVWRSHNFTGTLVAKRDVSGARKLRIECAAPPPLAYDVAEDGGHTFTLAE